MVRFAPIAVTAAVIAAALFPSAGQAKGPYFKAEISGGNLAAPIVINQLIPPDWLNNQPTDPPLPYSKETYTLRVYDADSSGVIGPEWVTWTYYPAHDGVAAAIRYNTGQFKTVDSNLARLVDGYLPQPPASSASTGAGSGDTALVWYIAAAASLAVGLTLGGGLVGRRLLKRIV